MVENSFVQMVSDVAGGEVADVRDIALAVAAGQWALDGDTPRWQESGAGGWVIPGNGMDHWVTMDDEFQELVVRVSINGSEWDIHVSHKIAHIGHALDVLAAEDLIPARFSTLGRRALEDHAEALDRAAAKIWAVARPGGGEPAHDGLMSRVLGLNQAADSARRFSGAQQAVLR
jgi:hypothetical protein